MQVNETLNEGLKRGYNITVTAAELEAKVNEKLAEAQPEVEMKGFRKGKVPMALLKSSSASGSWAKRCRKALMAPWQSILKNLAIAPRCSPKSK